MKVLNGASKKAAGAKLGNPRNTAQAAALGRCIQTVAADEFAMRLMPVVEAIRKAGATTLEAMSQALNQRGIPSARGGKWRASSIANLLSRVEASAFL